MFSTVAGFGGEATSRATAAAIHGSNHATRSHGLLVQPLALQIHAYGWSSPGSSRHAGPEEPAQSTAVSNLAR